MLLGKELRDHFSSHSKSALDFERLILSIRFLVLDLGLRAREVVRLDRSLLAKSVRRFRDGHLQPNCEWCEWECQDFPPPCGQTNL